ncbi:MAG: methyltransferase domain-containing protein, partial [Actinomycetota bacterium]
PASDHAPFTAAGIGYVGVDLAVGNAGLAAESGQLVIPASLFALPLADRELPAGWSMSTFQHVPDDRIDAALAEFVRVLRPAARVVIGLWGGRDEVIESESSTSGLQLPRHFTLRTHERIRELLGRHLVVDHDETFGSGDSDWEYHVSFSAVPSD